MEHSGSSPTPGRDLLTRSEAAAYARVSLWIIDSARRLGELRSTNAGSGQRVLIRRDWLDAWLGSG